MAKGRLWKKRAAAAASCAEDVSVRLSSAVLHSVWCAAWGTFAKRCESLCSESHVDAIVVLLTRPPSYSL